MPDPKLDSVTQIIISTVRAAKEGEEIEILWHNMEIVERKVARALRKMILMHFPEYRIYIDEPGRLIFRVKEKKDA